MVRMEGDSEIDGPDKRWRDVDRDEEAHEVISVGDG